MRSSMRFVVIVATLLVGGWLTMPASAQNRLWVLVNGALVYSGNITVNGNQTINGGLTTSGNITATTGSLQANAATRIYWNSRSAMLSSADKMWSLLDSANLTGEELSVGSATLGTCTGGTITAGSHNFAGGYTGNTSGSCVVNFGTPNWSNAPFCVAMSIASTTHPRVSAVATSSITITGGVSGEAITYVCLGRIGT